MLAHLENGKVALEEIHRFSNAATRVLGSLRWDVMRIFDELKIGLKKIGARKTTIESVSVDSWGVDYVLLRGGEPQLAAPHHYRDPRTDSTFKTALAKATRETIFAHTGIQF